MNKQALQGQHRGTINPMYPKVKVREEKDEDDDRVLAVDHKMVESLSIRVSSSSSSPPPAKEHQDVSPPFVARMQKPHVPKLVTPTISTCKETEKNDGKIDEKDRPNIKATSILRPRAVLSSPDNDVMIGNKNKIRAERPRVLRNHNVVQNRQANAQCKVIPSPIISKSLTSTKLSNEATGNKSDIKEKKGSVAAVPSQTRSLRSGKSSSLKT